MATLAGDRPWLAGYPAGIDWQARFPEQPLYGFLAESVARFADRPCLDFLGKGYSYAEIGALVRRAAKGLAALGVGRGVRVGLMLPNCPYYVIAYFAVLEAGGTVVNLNPLYAPPEIRHLVEDAGISILVTLDLKQLYAGVAPLLGQGSLQKLVICPMAAILPFPKNLLYVVVKRRDVATTRRDGAHLLFADLIANDGEFPPVAVEPPRDVAVLQYTGGTTGVPKGAMLTHQ